MTDFGLESVKSIAHLDFDLKPADTIKALRWEVKELHVEMKSPKRCKGQYRKFSPYPGF